MALDLGWRPDDLTVHLSWTGDFVAGLEYDDPAGWPPGTVIELLFFANSGARTPAVRWPATIVGVDADWWIPNERVIAEVLDPDNLTVSALVTLPDGRKVEWERGVATDE